VGTRRRLRSDYIGARALLGTLPKADWLLGDRGYDADWFRDALKDKGIRACIHDHKINRLDELLPWNWAPMPTAQEQAA